MKHITLGLTIAAAAMANASAQDITLKFHHIWNPQAMASVNLITPWCNKIAVEAQRDKLRLVIETAQEVWGGA